MRVERECRIRSPLPDPVLAAFHTGPLSLIELEFREIVFLVEGKIPENLEKTLAARRKPTTNLAHMLHWARIKPMLQCTLEWGKCTFQQWRIPYTHHRGTKESHILWKTLQNIQKNVTRYCVGLLLWFILLQKIGNHHIKVTCVLQ